VYVLLAILAVGVIIAIAFGVPALRKRIVPVLVRSKGYLVEFLRSPRQLFLNLVGNLGCALLSVACFELCVRAFGGHTSFAALVVIRPPDDPDSEPTVAEAPFRFSVPEFTATVAVVGPIAVALPTSSEPPATVRPPVKPFALKERLNWPWKGIVSSTSFVMALLM
jgi:hypothetical protein